MSAAPRTTVQVADGGPARPAPGRGAFWLVGLTVVGFLSASSAPSPLYVVYQQRWHFSELTLTAVFASYAIALLLALVTVGGLSDFVGRRPVLLAALALEATSMVLFLTAGGVPVLVLARVVQGLATGTATGVASAALVDLQPPGTQLAGVVNGAASTGGLALGALGAGLLVQLAPAATTLVFVVLLVAFVALVVPLWFLPETVRRRPGALASLTPRLAVPPQARATFLAVLPIVVATWSMGALYLSLGPSIAVVDLGLTSHLAGALVITLFTGSGAVASVAARHRPARPVMLAGSAVLAAGTSVAVLGVQTGVPAVFFLGTVVAGTGFGTGFLGAFRTLAVLAGPEERAELLAAVYVVNYLAFSLPAIAAGLLVPHLGLQRTATGYGVVVVVLALVVLLVAATQRLAARRQVAQRQVARHS